MECVTLRDIYKAREVVRGAAMHASLAAGRPVEIPEEPTLADSLGGGSASATA